MGVNDRLIVKAIRSGDLDEEILNRQVKDIIRTALMSNNRSSSEPFFDTIAHHHFARKVAGESMVLLKNHDQVLPVTREKYKNILVVGELAQQIRIQGVGSSEVNPTRMDDPLAELRKLAGEEITVDFAKGYDLVMESEVLQKEALEKASKADLILFFSGLRVESEGVDRTDIDLPKDQNMLIQELVKLESNIVVVNLTGSVVEMPWCNDVKGILQGWLAGQGSVGAIADLVFGRKNPSGKLAETFVKRLEDTPSYLNFPGEERNVYYGERIFVGYRYADQMKIDPLFPFGHGLSYTTFDYRDLTVSASEFTDKDIIKVNVKVMNSGPVRGKEVVQLYVHDRESTLQRPVKELKGFTKIDLDPGETSEVEFLLDRRDFSYYDSRRHQWIAESGEFTILVGSSSRDIRLAKTVMMQSTQEVPMSVDEYTFLSELLSNARSRELALMVFHDWIVSKGSPGQNVEEIRIPEFFAEMPLIKYPYITKGMVTREDIEDLIKKTNGLYYIP